MQSAPIVVCGTGIAGMACALGLARAGLGAALLGPRVAPPPASPEIYGARVYAISPAAQHFLEQLGVWGMLDMSRVTPVQGMQIYGDASGQVDLQAWQAVLPALAWILESSELERVLQQALRVYGLPWLEDRFLSLQDGVLRTEGGREMRPQLVVGADGASSPVRQAAGIAATSRSYDELGLVAHLNAERPHGGMARQWFLGDDGILALLPLPDTADGSQVSMVWSLARPEAQALLALAPDEQARRLAQRLAQVCGPAAGAFALRSAVLGFPLSLERSGMVAPGVALVGDAAHRVHPLAGQGLNLGLGDVEQLIAVLRDRPAHQGPGDMAVLRRYRRLRAEPVLAMGLATDGLHRLFAARSAPAVMLRNAGMQIVQKLPLLKRRLISAASR